MQSANCKSQIVAALSPLLTDPVVLLDELHARELLHRIVAARGDLDSGLNPTSAPSPGAPGHSAPSDVACIPIYGVLTKQPSPWDAAFGLCACYGVMETLNAAVNDQSVAQIVLDIDSPGGFVNGSVELADAVAAAARVKPVSAIIRGLCCSGAYWIASQCTQILARPECLVGNIGAYSVLVDTEEFFKQLGIRLTLVASGRRKGLGADGRVTQELIDETREIIRGTWEQFTQAVAAGRGIELAQIQALADGRSFMGPEALAAGLIDGLASTFDAAITTVTQHSALSTQHSNSTQHSKGALVDKTNTTPPQPQAAKKSDDNGGGNGPTQVEDSGNAKARKAFDEAADSAAKHRAKVRAALDAHTDMSDEAEAETKTSARKAIAAMRSASDEAKRCADKMEDDYGDTDETDPKDPQKKDPGSAPSGPASSQHSVPARRDTQHSSKAAFVKAFGEDRGLVLFGKDLSFEDATAAYVGDLKAAHAAKIAELEGQLTTARSENQELKMKLGALPRGNTPAAFSADSPAAGADDGKKITQAMPDGLRAWRDSLKLPSTN